MSTPTLLIECPPTPYQPERAWAIDVVVGTFMGLPYHTLPTTAPHYRLTLLGEPGGEVCLPDVFFQTPPAAWLLPASLPYGPLDGFEAPGGDRLPILFAGPPGTPWGLPLDVFGAAFFMLTRYEELVLEDRDDHGRFPAEASLAFREGFLELPVVDAYVDALWSALGRQWPGLARPTPASRLVLSHDADWPLGTLRRSPEVIARACMGDLVSRRDPLLAARRVRAYFEVKAGRCDGDPCNTFDFLMDTSERHGMQSAFNFITAHSGPLIDGTYEMDDPWIVALLRRIGLRGHEVGLHPSYGSFLDASRTRREFERLLEATRAAGVAQPRWGGRQHYLRWRNPVTWRNWAQAGLHYDSTLGYSEHIGFRAGTARPYQVFDLEARTPLPLEERPLIAMDVTLKSHMRLSPDESALRLASLRRVCRRYGGDLTLLWHNDSLCSREEKRWYQELVATLTG